MFTQADLLSVHDSACRKARDLMARKNHDYAGSCGTSPFANFERSSHMGLCSTEQGILVRMTDKMSRLSEFCKAGVLQVKEEGVEDTCLDLINYAVIFLAWSRLPRTKQVEFNFEIPAPVSKLNLEDTLNRCPPSNAIPVGTYKATEYVPNTP